ncbi:biotin transporter BioY [Occultella kanbiaonis]|uniref:biotin transporter BioY n=1 Tax=Occultella kanbiaonis TaxID=2675754 RepID=UPI0013D0216C|nr:biotin transporter BioY [Occultella kanbiaonis]
MSMTLSPPVLGDLLPATRLRDAALVVGGATTVALVGQISVPLPFTPVPLTLGTFAALAVGAALGPVRATFSLGLFLVAGIVGAPVFAGWGSGWEAASFGYALGYLPAAALAGWLAARGADRSVWRAAAMYAAAGAVIYLFGVPWFMVALGVGLPEAIALGVLPFLVGDALKAAAVALLLPGTWRLLGSRAGSDDLADPAPRRSTST